MLAVEMDREAAVNALLELEDEDTKSFLVKANAIVPVSAFTLSVNPRTGRYTDLMCCVAK
jgi:hypothetical protein